MAMSPIAPSQSTDKNKIVREDTQQLSALGYTEELNRNRSNITLLAQALIISNIPYGIGGPLSTVAAGGGQLSLFVGWIVVTIFYGCVAMSLAELASRYPTSAGPYFWTYQLASPKYRKFLSYVTGWTWVIGNWMTTMSAHFGLANYICATAILYKPDIEFKTWHITLIFVALMIMSVTISTLGNRFLPLIDTCSAILIGIAILATCISFCIRAGAGRHSLYDTFAHYDTTLSGWGKFSFAVGLLPSAYTYSGIGMITSMAEETGGSAIRLPQAIVSVVPVSFVAGLFFIVPICYTLPPLPELIDAPLGQGLAFVYGRVLASKAAGLVLCLLTATILALSCISIVTAVTRVTWSFARDQGFPLSRFLAKVNSRTQTPLNAALFGFAIQAPLVFISLGSTSAFNSFIGVSVVGLAVSYAIPIAVSILNRRKEVMTAQWNCGKIVGPIVNVIAVVWIMFLTVLLSMPAYIPVTPESMTYASVVLVGFMAMAFLWYIIHARKVYEGPPESDSLAHGF
ncbi:amino acid transporter [Lophiostoma macrostomum CBS 122681]|uniref:Amino acid transporter n=1 Tax=Lophiostoma macrostomum CBS 122681 TaxID=1314788 RepID=A0A6A6T428_9PLEO|nr:amino acid transporter [Lophiostoma macrostomum CBS 122681]